MPFAPCNYLSFIHAPYLHKIIFTTWQQIFAVRTVTGQHNQTSQDLPDSHLGIYRTSAWENKEKQACDDCMDKLVHSLDANVSRRYLSIYHQTNRHVVIQHASNFENRAVAQLFSVHSWDDSHKLKPGLTYLRVPPWETGFSYFLGQPGFGTWCWKHPHKMIGSGEGNFRQPYPCLFYNEAIWNLVLL